MAVNRLNHAVLYVRDIERSVAFYAEVLGFEVISRLGGIQSAAFLRAQGSTNDHDLGLFAIGRDASGSSAGRGEVGLYHLAWEVDTLADLRRLQGALAGRGAPVGATDHGTTKSLYARDPDGLELELAWLVPAELLDEAALEASSRIARLDLDAEERRYGSATLGGVGISRPAAV